METASFLYQRSFWNWAQKMLEIKAWIFCRVTAESIDKRTKFYWHYDQKLSEMHGTSLCGLFTFFWGMREVRTFLSKWTTKQLLPKRWMLHEYQVTLCSQSPGLFSRQLWRSKWRAGPAIPPGLPHDGGSLSRPLEWPYNGWLYVEHSE